MTAERPSARSLLRVLGLGFGVAVTIGNTIGAGILRTPGEVAGYLPNSAAFLSIWAFAGLLPLLAAPAFAELATMLPRAGGYYVFTREALGDYPAFVVGWTDWLANCGSTSAVAIVICEYTLLLVPSLRISPNTTAVLIVLVIAALQWTGIKTGSWFQQLSTLLKAVAFIAVAIACFAWQGGQRNPQPIALQGGSQLLTAIILALQAAIYAYDGWYGVIYFSEETYDAYRNVPRSIFGGTIAVLGIYLLVNVAVMRVLPVSQMAHDKLALGTAANVLWGKHGDTIIQVTMIVAMLSAINAFMLMMCRIPFAMGRDMLFPRIATHVNAGGTPDVALTLSTLAAILFIATGTFNQVIAVLAFFFSLDYVLALTAVFILRRLQPDRTRPYRAWGHPWTTAFALVAYLAFLVAVAFSDHRNSVYALLLLAVTCPLYFASKRISSPGKESI